MRSEVERPRSDTSEVSECWDRPTLIRFPVASANTVDQSKRYAGPIPFERHCCRKPESVSQRSFHGRRATRSSGWGSAPPGGAHPRKQARGPARPDQWQIRELENASLPLARLRHRHIQGAHQGASSVPVAVAAVRPPQVTAAVLGAAHGIGLSRLQGVDELASRSRSRSGLAWASSSCRNRAESILGLTVIVVAPFESALEGSPDDRHLPV